jgi:hypothetical protein
MILIKLDSKGPILFKQKRIGRHKKHFNILKFRTMRIDSPKDTPTHLLENPEQYITKMGKFLRKTSLDELPQIINILKGNMSIIGPRPALWNQFDLIEERDKYNVHKLYPGITGYAQIKGRDTLPIKDKAKLDGEVLDGINDHLLNITTAIGAPEDNYSSNKYSLAKVGVNASMGIFSAAVTYGKSGKDGSGVLNNLAQNGMIGYNVDLSGTADAKMWSYDLAAQVTSQLNLALNYDTIKSDHKVMDDYFDHDEFYLQATYDLSKNLSTYVRLATGEKFNYDDDKKIDYNAGRLQVEYKF